MTRILGARLADVVWRSTWVDIYDVSGRLAAVHNGIRYIPERVKVTLARSNAAPRWAVMSVSVHGKTVDASDRERRVNNVFTHAQVLSRRLPVWVAELADHSLAERRRK